MPRLCQAIQVQALPVHEINHCAWTKCYCWYYYYLAADISLLLPNDLQSPGSASKGEVPLKGVGQGGARAAITNQCNCCGKRISAGTRHQKNSTATQIIAKVPSSVSHLFLICSSFVSHLSFICRSFVLRVPGTFGNALGALRAVLEAYRKHLGHPMRHS